MQWKECIIETESISVGEYKYLLTTVESFLQDALSKVTTGSLLAEYTKLGSERCKASRMTRNLELFLKDYLLYIVSLKSVSYDNVVDIQRQQAELLAMIKSSEDLKNSLEQERTQLIQENVRNVEQYTVQMTEYKVRIEQLISEKQQLEQHVQESKKIVDTAQNYTCIVYGNKGYDQDTGIDVTIGSIVDFSASGSIVYDNDGHSCMAKGTDWTDTQDKEDPMYMKPHGGLIGRVDDGTYFFIGSESHVKIRKAGRLYLGINDKYYTGNTGEYSVNITIKQ